MIKKTIHLDCNENPEPISAQVLSAVAEGAKLINRYTFETEERVLKKVAQHFDIPSENIMLVRGIDECVDHICREFPNMRYATVWPGFDWYSNRIRINHREEFHIRLNPDLSINIQDLSQLASSDVVLLANPSNPAGKLLSPEEYGVIEERAGKILIDETYIDYSFLGAQKPQFDQKKMIFRSFSKSFGLAGARLGIVFACEAILTSMKKKQWYCNVGTMELCALAAVLDNGSMRAKHVEKTIRERERVKLCLTSLGIHVHDSETNFLLINDTSTPGICEFLKQHGVMTRRTDSFGLHGYTRITIGLEEENTIMLNKLRQYQHFIQKISPFGVMA